MRAVGYAARAICAQNKWRFHDDESNYLLDVSELAVLALKQQGPHHRTLCDMAFTTVCSEATRWDPSSQELATQQSEILHNTLTIVRLTFEKHSLSSEFARALCAVGLSLNRQNGALIGKAATHSFASDDQVEYLQRLGDSCVVLGLCGLLCALESDHLLDSVQESELVPVFHSLYIYVVEKEALAELPGDALGDVDIARCLIETASHCYQCLYKPNLEPQALEWLLHYMLREWRRPSVVSTVAALLEHPASDYIRAVAVHFVAQSEPEVAGMGIAILSSAFYEAIRLENTLYEVNDDNVSRLTQHFEQFPARHGQDVHVVICALLTRLLDENLFRWLIVLLHRARSQGDLKHWRGIEVGHVLRFWGERIIHWGRGMLREGESGDAAQKLQEIFTSEGRSVDASGHIDPGAPELMDLLWREIEKAEDLSTTLNPPITSDNRVSRRIHWPWRNRHANDEAV
ncbi:hypothetical protein BDV93DRAFT_562521 [Ceratobasidium sp. AG-I]|nr:hypothetical protein BDV93DRAFT_562521 [Ceratobasidium sp. AG-I]